MVAEYSEAIKKVMQVYHQSLGEKASRQYAAVEAMKLGYGGISYISRLLSVSRKTILNGKKELQSCQPAEQTQQRQRRSGGGRKKNNPSALHRFVAGNAA